MDAIVTAWGMKWGFQNGMIWVDERPYLSRWILHFGIGSLRLHKFWRGDQARAVHDHPFWYITLPFTSYLELVIEPDEMFGEVFHHNLLRAGLPHFRPASHRHIVKCRADWCLKPWWTLVLTGRHHDDWYFYPSAAERVHWREWS